ncbi:MAG: hypothetical protein ACK5LP_10710 [Campylobacteraceae bacterium]
MNTKTSLLLKSIGTVLLFLLFTGCTVKSPNLPTSDNIVKFLAQENMVVAESEKYTYIFSNKDAPQKYKLYENFIENYKDYAVGVYVIFYVNNNEVNATYNVIVDTKDISTTYINDLKNIYHAKKTKEANQFIVQFSAKGYYLPISDKHSKYPRVPMLKKDDELQTPIHVTIEDETTTASPLTEAIILPFFPVIMMYGCITGPCI